METLKIRNQYSKKTKSPKLGKRIDLNSGRNHFFNIDASSK